MPFNNKVLNSILEEISKKNHMSESNKKFALINKNIFEYNGIRDVCNDKDRLNESSDNEHFDNNHDTNTVINQNKYNTNDINENVNEKNDINENVNEKNDIKENVNEKNDSVIDVYMSPEKSKNQDKVNYIFEFLKDILENENYIDIHIKINDSFISAFINIVNQNDIIGLSHIKTNNFIEAFKEQMYINMNENNIYDKYNYKRLKVTKTFVNKIYEEKMDTQDINIQIISDYYNLGILIIKNRFMTIFDNHINNNERLWIIIIKDNHGRYYPVLNDKNQLYKYERIEKIIEYFNIHFKNWKMKKLENISKYTSAQLQEIASKFNIKLKKTGKNGNINKLKKEIYDEINDCII